MMKTVDIKQPRRSSDEPEIPWSEISAFVERLVKEPRGQRRAANLIREVASSLAKAEACEDLANAAHDCQQMLVRAWEIRWEKSRAAAALEADCARGEVDRRAAGKFQHLLR